MPKKYIKIIKMKKTIKEFAGNKVNIKITIELLFISNTHIEDYKNT